MDEKELELAIMQGESLTSEFKQSFSPKIDEDMVAFSNSRGGRILLGVEDSKTVTGFELTNDIRGRILSLARNCKPSIDVSISQIGEITVISVPEGDEKPYSCSSGYFRRLDGATQKMDHGELRMMFARNEPVPFEERTAKGFTLEEVSKKKIAAFLEEAKLGRIPAESLLSSLGMYSDGKVNNAGIMFFAEEPRKFILQCQMSCIAFKGTEQLHIFDRMDVKDDLLMQFNAAIFFLKKHLNLVSTITGVNRVDGYDIPLDALREAVANALMHRDYSVRGTDLTIHVFDDRVELTNPSRLPVGTDPKTLEGVSVRNNEIIADMFFRIDKAERAGTGLKKMREICQKAGVKSPEIMPGPFYKLIFRRTARVAEKVAEKVTENQAKILELISADRHVTAVKLAGMAGISRKSILENIRKLKKVGLLARIGSDKGGHWEVIIQPKKGGKRNV